MNERDGVTDRRDKIRITAPGGFVMEAFGHEILITIAVIVLGIVAWIAYEGRSEHKQIVEALQELVYVNHLPMDQRSHLQLNMPSSLQMKVYSQYKERYERQQKEYEEWKNSQSKGEVK